MLKLLAADPITNPLIENNGLEGAGYFDALVKSLLGLSFVVASIIFIFIMVMGAIQWISSSGEKGAVQAAQSKITNAIIGLVVLLSLYAILKLIGDFFGLEVFQNFSINIDNLILGN
jgi:hypothetical protein